MFPFSVYSYLGYPFFAVWMSPLQPCSTQPTYAFVLLVLSFCGESQITQRIIVTISIYVIDLIRWPFATHIEKGQSMSEIICAIYSYFSVSRSTHNSSLASRKITASSQSPSENAAIGIIAQQIL